MSVALPYTTADLHGIGGRLKSQPEDFVVEEVPAYAPVGEGPHVFAWIEKRGVTTAAAIAGLARALGVAERDVGSAGMKDRHAVTRQFLSFPPPVAPEAVMAARADGVTIVSAARHGNKLRTGHLRGNRFALVVRGVVMPADEAAARAAAVLSRLAEPPGTPNWYGEQRFGSGGDNAAAGRALLAGGRGRGGGRERRFLVSAYQSELFNRALRARLTDGLYRRVIAGDVLVKASGGMFDSTDTALDQARLEAGEVCPTGPMFGHQMRSPAAGSEAWEREAAILAEEGIALEDFGRLGALATGTRRPFAVRLEDALARPVGPDAICVEFALPAGAYATAVMREVMKSE